MTTNLNIHLLGESSKPTTTSADSGQVVLGGQSVQTATQPGLYAVIEIRSDDDVWPDGYQSVEQLVSESESDPTKSAAMEEARRWAAETLYPKETSLRVLRMLKGLSQDRLAKMIGTNQAHIARIESGNVDVQVGTLQRMAEALGADELSTVDAFLNIRRTVATTTR